MVGYQFVFLVFSDLLPVFLAYKFTCFLWKSSVCNQTKTQIVERNEQI